MIAFERREASIVDRLSRHLADQADQDFLHGAIRTRWQNKARDLIDQWSKAPLAVVSDTDRLCQEAYENRQAMAKAKEERKEARKALWEAHEDRAVPDPTIATIRVRDAVSGKIFAITLPAESVAEVITNRLSA